MSSTIHEIFEKLREYWERISCAVILLLCLVCCVCGITLLMDMPHAPAYSGSSPEMVRLFSWENGLAGFDWPKNVSRQGNPFAHVFVNSIKPAPKAEPVKLAPPKPSLPEQVKVEQKPAKAPEPPPPAPKEPEIIVSVLYRGYYVDVAGNMQALLGLSSPKDKKLSNLMCKEGGKIADGVTLTSISEDMIVVCADGWKPVQIKWNEKAEIK